MPHRSRLIPLLTLILVIQSVVAVLPHVHGSVLNDQARQVSSYIDATHHCLACSVHAPVVESVAGVGGAAGLTITIAVSVDGGSNDFLSVLSTASPRGPPRIV
jgi:hypothetical protein